MPLTYDQLNRARVQDEGLPSDVAAEVLIAFERWIKRRTTKGLAEELGVAVQEGGESCFVTFDRDDRDAAICELSEVLRADRPMKQCEKFAELRAEFRRFSRRPLSVVRASSAKVDQLLVKIFSFESSCGPVPESDKQLGRVLRSVSRCQDSKL